MKQRGRRPFVIALAVASALLGGCRADTASSPRATSIRFTADTVWAPPSFPPVPTVEVMVSDAAGQPVYGAAVEWETLDTRIAQVWPLPSSASAMPMARVFGYGPENKLTWLIARLPSGAADTIAVRNSRPTEVFDVVTNIDSYQVEVACTSGFSRYCTFATPVTDVRLSGTLRIAFDGVRGAFSECAPTWNTSCSDTVSYATPLGGYAPGLGQDWGVEVHRVNVWGPALYFSGRAQGDSVYGTVRRRISEGRSPPTYTGTFVARRRN